MLPECSVVLTGSSFAVITEKNCVSRSRRTAVIVRYCMVTTGSFNSETVQEVMAGAVERRVGNELPASPVEWLTDNGSCYRANETRRCGVRRVTE